MNRAVRQTPLGRTGLGAAGRQGSAELNNRRWISGVPNVFSIGNDFEVMYSPLPFAPMIMPNKTINGRWVSGPAAAIFKSDHAELPGQQYANPPNGLVCMMAMMMGLGEWCVGVGFGVGVGVGVERVMTKLPSFWKFAQLLAIDWLR